MIGSLAPVSSRSERLNVERAALGALDGLRRAVGGYLEAVEPYAGQLGGDDLDAVRNRLLGRSPAVLVSTGDGDYDTKAMSRRRAVVVLELHVDCISGHLRSPEARLAGDEAGELGQGDPGLYVILADVRDRLMGMPLGVAGSAPPILSREDVLLVADDLAICRATYLVRCAVEAQPPAGAPVHKVESVEHRSNLVEAEAAPVNPVAVGEVTTDA